MVALIIAMYDSAILIQPKVYSLQNLPKR